MPQSTIYLCLKKTRAEKFYFVFLEYVWRLYVCAKSLDVLFSGEKLVTFFINEASGDDRGDFWLNLHHLLCKSRVCCLHWFPLEAGSISSSFMSQCHCRNCSLGTVT